MTTNQKHLKSGSECPPLKENQLRLYSMRFCPFVRRAKLVLAAKNIPYEEVRIDLTDEPDWYLKKNPAGEVPLLEWIDPKSKETQSIPESLIVSDYLDNLHPEHRLYPDDPYLRAKQQVLLGKFGNVLPAFYKVFRQEGQDAVEQLNQGLAVYEEALQGTFFGGSKPAMIDYMIWPWFERIPSLKEAGFVLNADGKQPKLAAWVKAMQENDAVKKTKVPEEIQKKFYESYRQGKADYDIE
jgi:glutathione S-transferase